MNYFRLDVVTLATADGKLAYTFREAIPGAEGKIPLPSENVHRLLPGPGLQQNPGEGTEYDLDTGKARRTIRLDFPLPNRLEILRGTWISADGKTSAMRGNQITVWSTLTGSILYKIQPATNKRFTAMAVTSDEKTLIVGDDGNTLQFHDLATGKKLRSFGIGDEQGVANIAVSADGKLLLAVGQNRSLIRLWDFEKGTEEGKIDFPEAGTIETLLFTTDSRTIIAGIRSADGSRPLAIRTWNALSGEPGRAWTRDRAIGTTVAVSPDGKVLASMNSAGVIRFWDMATGAEQRTVEANPSGITGVSFAADGKTILTIGDDFAVRRWDAVTGRLLAKPLALPEGRSPEFFAGDKLAITDLVGKYKLQLLDAATGKILGKLLLTGQGIERVFTPDGKRMATSTEGFVEVFDVTTGKLIHSWQASKLLNGADGSAPIVRGLTPDGMFVILQGEGVAVFEAATGKLQSSWLLNERQVLDGIDVVDKLSAILPKKKGGGPTTARHPQEGK